MFFEDGRDEGKERGRGRKREWLPWWLSKRRCVTETLLSLLTVFDSMKWNQSGKKREKEDVSLVEVTTTEKESITRNYACVVLQNTSPTDDAGIYASFDP